MDDRAVDERLIATAILNLTEPLSVQEFARKARLDEAVACAAIERLLQRKVLEEYANGVFVLRFDG